MNTELMKAVERATPMCGRESPDWVEIDEADWDTILAALRDLEEENAWLQSAWHVETLNEKDRLIAAQEAENDRVKSSLATANALLRECDGVARKRGDKYGLCDAIDNDGQPYQSAHLAAHLQGAGDEA